MRHSILAAALLALAGCASSPISPDDAAAVPAERIHSHGQQTRERMAAVQITRDSATGLNGSGCTVAVDVDRQHALDIHSGETATIWIAVGQTIVSAESRGLMCGMGPVETQINAEPGDPNRLRVSIGRGSRLNIIPTAY